MVRGRVNLEIGFQKCLCFKRDISFNQLKLYGYQISKNFSLLLLSLSIDKYLNNQKAQDHIEANSRALPG